MNKEYYLNKLRDVDNFLLDLELKINILSKLDRNLREHVEFNEIQKYIKKLDSERNDILRRIKVDYQ